MTRPAAATPTEPLRGRAAAALAALLAALSIGLGAYAAHAGIGRDAERLALAALYLMFHSLAVLGLLGRRGGLLAICRWGLLAGSLLFCGSLVGAALAGWPSTLAPLGGITLILSWLLLGIALLRGEGRQA